MRSLTDRRCRGRRPRRPAEVRGGGRRRRGQDPSLRCKNKWVATARLRAGRARPLRNMVMWDVGRPAPRPPGRLAAMRSLTDRRCRGRRPRRPAEVCGGGRCAGRMNFSPTGYPLAVVFREAAEGSRPLPTMQRINGRQWQGCGPGVPGPYGLLFPVQKFSKNNLANARIICYDNKLKTCSVPKGHGHIEQRESF